MGGIAYALLVIERNNAQACDCSSDGRDVRYSGDRRSSGGRDRDQDIPDQLGPPAADSSAGGEMSLAGIMCIPGMCTIPGTTTIITT